MRYSKFAGEVPRSLNLWSVFDLVVADFEAADGYCQLQFMMTVLPGHETVSVDWGDGVSESCVPGFVGHNYTAGGPYRVRIGPEAKWWRVYEGYRVKNNRLVGYARPAIFPRVWSDTLESCSGAFAGWNDSRTHGVQGPIIPWGRAMKSTSCCYESCDYVTGAIPEWPADVEKVGGTYRDCAGLTGAIPDWSRALVDAEGCYDGCTGLSGRVPAWPDTVREVDYAYRNCMGLTGSVPPWPDELKSLCSVYSGCTGLTGIIPAWPRDIKETNRCYENCTSLTGAWTDDPARLMPEGSIFTGSAMDVYMIERTVAGCSDAVRALFYERWGGSLPNPA